MKIIHRPTIEMTDEQKETLSKSVGVFREILSLLEENESNGWTAFEEGLNICDDFYKIYNICITIFTKELIP